MFEVFSGVLCPGCGAHIDEDCSRMSTLNIDSTASFMHSIEVQALQTVLYTPHAHPNKVLYHFKRHASRGHCAEHYQLCCTLPASKV